MFIELKENLLDNKKAKNIILKDFFKTNIC